MKRTTNWECDENLTSRLHIQRASVEVRRSKVIELVSKGLSLTEIAKILGANVSTVSRDYQHIRDTASKIIDGHISQAPLELEKCFARLNAVHNEACKLVDSAKDHKEKIAALSLAMKATMNIAAMITNIRNARHVAEPDVDAESNEGKANATKSSAPDPAETVF